MRYHRWSFSNRSQSVNQPYGQIAFPAPVECSSALPQAEFRRIPAFSRHQFSRPESRQEVLIFTKLNCPARAGCTGSTCGWIVHILDSDCRVEVDEGLDEVLPLATQ